MTRDDADSDANGTGRRTFLKGIGVGAGAALVGAGAGAAAGIGRHDAIDDGFDLSTAGPHEALVVFTANDAADRISDLDAPTHVFEVLPIAFGELTAEQIREVAAWSSVRGVYPNRELEYHNDDARDVTGAAAVQTGTELASGYTGDGVHVAVIDSGIDGDHPDLAPNLAHNFKFVGVPEVQDEPVMWVDAGPADTDDNGHGTHTSGSVAGTGAQSDGQFKGMAPEADLTMYSTGVGLLVVYIVAAFDHLLARKRRNETDVVLTSNSYGPIEDGQDVDPAAPVNVATYYGYREDILSVFSAGNSGPALSTLSQYAKLPHTLGVAATFDDGGVTAFSSRGRPNPDYEAEPGEDDTSFDYDADEYTPNNYDRRDAFRNFVDYQDPGEPDPEGPYGIYRNGVAAPGDLVMSTMAPTDPLQVYPATVGPEEQDARLWYSKVSGTSMSCPVTTGCLALVYEAFREYYGRDPEPLEAVNLLEATASHDPVDDDLALDDLTEDEVEKADVPANAVEDATNMGEDKGEEYGPADWGYTPENAGTGFVDVLAAVEEIEGTPRPEALPGFARAHRNIVSD